MTDHTKVVQSFDPPCLWLLHWHLTIPKAFPYSQEMIQYTHSTTVQEKKYQSTKYVRYDPPFLLNGGGTFQPSEDTLKLVSQHKEAREWEAL